MFSAIRDHFIVTRISSDKKILCLWDTLDCGKEKKLAIFKKNKKEMDCVTMKLVERETGLPLDLVVLINSFLYERLTDENFHEAIPLWFENKEECKFRFGHISDWKTSRVTNMKGAFFRRRNFNEDIGRWNVSNVTNMGFMFCDAPQFNQDIGQWDVSNVTNMGYMFFGASQFNQDIGQWDVSSVTKIGGMFCDASLFNQDIGQWDVSSVTDVGAMFEGASQFDRDLSRWDVSNAMDRNYLAKWTQGRR
jgi:surface protein